MVGGVRARIPDRLPVHIRRVPRDDFRAKENPAAVGTATGFRRGKAVNGRGLEAHVAPTTHAAHTTPAAHTEIGCASRRERVFKSVSILVAEAYLKENQHTTPCLLRRSQINE